MSVEPEDQNGYRSDKPPPDENKLFVGGISWHMQDKELKDSTHQRDEVALLSL